MAAILEVSGLTVDFPAPDGRLTAVRGVDLKLEAGRTAALVGESGSGKSATCTALMGLLPPTARVGGRFLLGGLPFEPARGEQRGRGLAMIFQNPLTALNPVRTVGGQIRETVLRHHRGCGRKEAQRRSLELLSEVELREPDLVYRQYPHQLSGGMRQRVSIAIALACEPSVLLADEPTTALDVTVAKAVLGLLKGLQERRGMAILFVTHDMDAVERIADQVQVMYAGQLVESGPLQTVLAAPAHPYTRLLLACRPRLEPEALGRRLSTIEGTAPRRPPPEGCAFASRCPAVQGRCRREAPPLEAFEGQGRRQVRCWFAGEGA